MALPSRYGIDKKINSMGGLSAYENGGKGSGNFGHSGRPGEVGGSGKGSGGSNTKNIDDEIEKTKKAIEGLGEFLGSIPPSGILSSEMEGIEKASKELEKARKKLEKLEKEKKGSGKKQSGEISLKGKSLYEKVHMIEPGDEVHITPKDNLPNFDRKIKVDYIQDGTIHYGSSETSDGYTYPAWAIKDITKIIRKKKNEVELNGGKGSGNFGHAGRPGEVGGSGKGGETYPGSNVPRAIMEGYLTSSSKYDDIDKMSIVITPKGNLQLLYDGKDVATIGGNKYLIQEASKLGMIEEDGSRLEGPAKTRDEYNYKTASEKCQDEASDVYASLCEHAEWIASDGSFAEGYNEDDYWKLADRLGTRGDKIGDKSNRYTQRDLVEGFKRTQKDVEPYGLLDGSSSNDKLDEFMSNYDFDKKNSYSGEVMMGMPTRYGVEKKINSMGGLSAYENGGKGSGNFGHAGRPGEVGGSSKDGLGSSAGKYDVKDGKEARKYLTDDAGTSLGMLWEVGVSPENYGFTYDVLGKPTRLSRFEKDADDKLWRAWASMQKVQDNPDSGDVRGEGLATSHDALKLAKAVIATSQTAYLPSERKVAQEQTEKFVKGVKDEVKKQKIKLTADSKKYGETDARKATRKALDDISSAMDGFIGYDKPSREYKD